MRSLRDDHLRDLLNAAAYTADRLEELSTHSHVPRRTQDVLGELAKELRQAVDRVKIDRMMKKEGD